MQVISVNIGLPREVIWKGKTVSTGIFKEPVEGRIRSPLGCYLVPLLRSGMAGLNRGFILFRSRS
jgi:MOSC domain-containing protein YiiM